MTEGLEDRLRTAVRDERRGTLIFSGITILLTPLLLVVVIALLLMGLALLFSFFKFPFEWLESPLGLPTGCNIVLALILSVYLGSPRVRRRDLSRFERWFLTAGAVYLGLVAMTYLTGWPASRPGLFWSLYGAGALAMLALLGKGSMSNDPGYLGWYESIGWKDDGEDDEMYVASEGARFVAFLPGLVLDCYGQIFGSFWLWHELDSREVRLMSQALEALGRKADEEARDLLRMAPKASGDQVLRWLVKLDLVSAGPASLRLTSTGSEFLATRGLP